MNNDLRKEIIERFGCEYVQGKIGDKQVYKIIGEFGKPSFDAWIIQSLEDGTCYRTQTINEGVYNKVRPVTKEIEEFVPLEIQPTYYVYANGEKCWEMTRAHGESNTIYGTMKKKTVTTWEVI